MFFNMKSEKHKVECRAYIRALPGLPAKQQRQMAMDAGCHWIYAHGERGDRDVRQDWIASLRPGDTAWLPDLLCLITPAGDRPRRYRPTADLATQIAAILARGAIIYDARSAIYSNESTAWVPLVERTIVRASQGVRSRVQIEESARTARAARQMGSVTRWRASSMAKRRAIARKVWTSVLYSSDDEAHAALDDPDLKALSKETVRRILGPRRPGKRVGGRPRKTR